MDGEFWKYVLLGLFIALAILAFPLGYGLIAKKEGGKFKTWFGLGFLLIPFGPLGIIIFKFLYTPNDDSIPTYSPSSYSASTFVPPTSPTSVARKVFTAQELDNAKINESRLMDEGNEYISAALEARSCGNISSAKSNFDAALKIMLLLCKVDEAYYEKYLYALLDEMGKFEFHDRSNRYQAKEYFQNAYYFCARCAQRDPAGPAIRDLTNIRTYLTDSNYCG